MAVGRDEHVAAADWAILTTAHPSVLLIGPDAATRTIVSELRPCLRSPVSWRAHDAGPGPLPITGTLIIRDIGALNLHQQQQLFDWVEVQGRDVQVVAVSARPVFPLVEAGVFLAALYYRLNIVYLHLATSPAEDIAHRAYELYEQRGGRHGHDWHDWFQAERELQPHQERPTPF